MAPGRGIVQRLRALDERREDRSDQAAFGERFFHAHGLVLREVEAGFHEAFATVWRQGVAISLKLFRQALQVGGLGLFSGLLEQRQRRLRALGLQAAQPFRQRTHPHRQSEASAGNKDLPFMTIPLSLELRGFFLALPALLGGALRLEGLEGPLVDKVLN